MLCYLQEPMQVYDQVLSFRRAHILAAPYQ